MDDAGHYDAYEYKLNNLTDENMAHSYNTKVKNDTNFLGKQANYDEMEFDSNQN
jgi:hypothetical protein